MSALEEMIARMAAANPEWAPIGTDRPEPVEEAKCSHLPSSMVEHALDLADRLQFPVFPLRPGTSRPATKHGFHDATTDPDRIRQMWGTRSYGIGIATGLACDVLDIDHPDLGIGIADLPPVVAELVDDPSVPLVQSGGGKWHMYFAPTGLGRRIRFSEHCDWLGTDGYVVAPPSIKGRTYQWVRSIVGPLPEAPAELVEFAGRKRTAPVESRLSAGGAGLGQRLDGWQCYGLLGLVVDAREGERNHTLNWAANRVGLDVHRGRATRQQGDDACERLERVALLIGLEAHETDATIRSGYTAGLNGKGAA